MDDIWLFFFHLTLCLQLILQDIFQLCEAHCDFSSFDSILSDNKLLAHSVVSCHNYPQVFDPCAANIHCVLI